MTNIHWEKVASGRYASEYNGHVIQAIRKDGPVSPGDRPYIAVVDRKPVSIGAWSLGQAKTQAIQHVERQLGKTKAESVFKNGNHPAKQSLVGEPALGSAQGADRYPPAIPDPVDGRCEAKIQPPPEPEPEPLDELDGGPPESIVSARIEPEARPMTEGPWPVMGLAGQLAITGQLNDGDLLDTLNALKSALELLREHAKLDCTVNLPPVLKL